MSNNASNAAPVSFQYNFARPPVQLEFLNGVRDFTLSGMGPYVAETTQRFAYGAPAITWDGRLYRYCYAGTGGVASEFGAVNGHGGGAGNNTTGATSNTISSATAPAQVGDASGVAGSTCITVKIYSGSFHGEIGNGLVAKDELVGGYAIVGNGTSQHPDVRGIVGNTAIGTASASGTIQVYLDGPIFQTITAGTTNIEVLANPYSKVINGNVDNSGYATVVCVPAVTAAATYSFWGQRRGPCWVTSSGNTNYAINSRSLYFLTNGSIGSGDALTYAGKAYQYAGYALEKTASAQSGPPLVFLLLE
jgi:hypothetical protein